MLHHRPLVLVLLPLLALPFSQAAAQLQTGNIHVYVTYPDDRAPTAQLKVGLIGSGNQVAETYTNDHGQAQFLNVAIGNYQVSVTGQGIQATLSEMFEVDARRGAQSIFVRVRPAAENGESNATKAADTTVSANDLKVPKKASQEFDKATKLIAKQQWQKAIDQLNKALALYPAYAEAYNNLGVVYARLGDSVKERESLQKATAANDHFAPAFVNLARMEMREHNFAAAEADLNKATTADPTDVRTLALLAQAQLLDVHYEDAIASARKVHAMPHDSYALVHYVAARACERLHRLSEAVSQLEIFLSEEPSGERAAAARREMAAIQNQLH
jgi:tetratricopeptide (TPR) repeat protein